MYYTYQKAHLRGCLTSFEAGDSMFAVAAYLMKLDALRVDFLTL
jgi:hypothetical protein